MEGDRVSISAAEARARLIPLIAEVNRDRSAVEITSKSGSAFLIAADEYRSLRETVYLLRSPRNAARLRSSVANAPSGGTAAGERDE